MTPATKARLLAAIAFGALLLRGTPSFAAPPAPVVAPEMRLPHISIMTLGTSGSPVILIPGLASPRAVWDGIAPALAAHHRVILVQVNGFAGDDAGANPKSGLLDGVVTDLHAYIVGEKLREAAVIGHSMGGLVGMMLAKAHPDDLAKLMIVDSLPFFPVLMAPPGVDPTPTMIAPQAAAMRDRIVATYGTSPGDAAVAAQARGLALKLTSVAKVTAWAKAADPRVTGEALYEDLTTDLRPALAAIATPITLLYPWNAGGPTRPMADPFYRKQYAAAPHVTFVDIGDSGHFVMLDQPEAFAAAVTGFVGDR